MFFTTGMACTGQIKWMPDLSTGKNHPCCRYRTHHYRGRKWNKGAGSLNGAVHYFCDAVITLLIMLHLDHSTVYYCYNGAADMRKGFDALCGMVSQHMQSSVLTGGVYIFVNRRRNQIKLLTWEGDGLAIYYKRLEKGMYELPAIAPDSTLLSCL